MYLSPMRPALQWRIEAFIGEHHLEQSSNSKLREASISYGANERNREKCEGIDSVVREMVADMRSSSRERSDISLPVAAGASS